VRPLHHETKERRHRGPTRAEETTKAVMTIERGVKRILTVMSVLVVLFSAWLLYPDYTHIGVVMFAAVLTVASLALLWAAFFTVRWIVRGFTGQ
jgi:hypothetical protein